MIFMATNNSSGISFNLLFTYQSFETWIFPFKKEFLGLNIYKMMMKVKQGYLNCWLSQLITHILVLQEVEAKIESFRQHLKLKLADLPSPPEEQKRLIRYYWH